MDHDGGNHFERMRPAEPTAAVEHPNVAADRLVLASRAERIGYAPARASSVALAQRARYTLITADPLDVPTCAKVTTPGASADPGRGSGVNAPLELAITSATITVTISETAHERRLTNHTSATISTS
jgi:hypothetical protein